MIAEEMINQKASFQTYVSDILILKSYSFMTFIVIMSRC